MMINLLEILSTIPEFTQVIAESPNLDGESYVIRANLSTPEDARQWLSKFGKATCTHWIIDKSRQSNPCRFVMHKQWTCQHTARNKTATSGRNMECRATIDILIKKNTASTRRRDIHIRNSPPLCGVITAKLHHNHSLKSIRSLKYLPASKEIKAEFMQYFSDGLAPSEAIRAHENTIMMQSDTCAETLANGALNPTQRVVYHLHDRWTAANVESCAAPLDKLKEKINHYAEQGISVVVKDTSPFAVLVVTDLMIRTQAMPGSEEMIFVDSSSSGDKTQPTLTALLAATKAGAVPIGIVIHECQSTAGYTDAFAMFSQHFPLCFGGKKTPTVLITDDLVSVKAALHSVWPEAQQLLCHFQMAQAEWRWLNSSASGVAEKERKHLMKLFLKVMYAENNDELAKAMDEIENLENQDKFIARLHKNLLRKEEWIALYRNALATCHENNSTNNYAEATIRILRDIIAQRTKAFNVVALVEFCGSTWNQYLVDRLLDFAQGGRVAPLLGNAVLCRRMRCADPEKIRQLSSTTYTVPSGTKVGVEYTVDTDICVCSCVVGSGGVFCKHQAVLHEQLRVMLPNVPPIDPTERFALAQLALGERCPPPKFFKDLKADFQSPSEQSLSFFAQFDEENYHADASFESLGVEDEPNSPKHCDLQKSIEQLKFEMERITHLLTVHSAPYLVNLAEDMGKIRTEAELIDFIEKFTACVSSCPEKIQVQPKSVSRRRARIAGSSRKFEAGPSEVLTTIAKMERDFTKMSESE